MLMPVKPRFPSRPCNSVPNTKRPKPSRKLSPTRRSIEGSLGPLDNPSLLMQSTLCETIGGNHMIHLPKPIALCLFCLLSFVPISGQTTATAPASKPVSTPAHEKPRVPGAPVYEVFAVRYASIPDFPVSALVTGADRERKLSIAMTVWLVRGNGRNILVDSGFYRPQFFKNWKVEGFLKP